MSKNVRVLIVDDTLINIAVLQGALEERYSVDIAKSGREALDVAVKNTPDIILLDFMMPEMDGFETLERIRTIPSLSKTKIIMISAVADLESRLKSYHLGAHDYVAKPFEEEELIAKIEVFAELVGVNELKEAFSYTIRALARAAEASDEDTGAHIIRVNEYCFQLAKDFGLSEQFCLEIRSFAQMHDVGKIQISKEILNKKGRLTPSEFADMKAHPIFGARIIGESAQLKMAHEIALTHHEKWDGTGYPCGLKGNAIPMAGRIVALADVYDALRSERCYKAAFTHEKTMNIFINGDDRLIPTEHFDPQLLNVFIQNHEKYESIYSLLN